MEAVKANFFDEFIDDLQKICPLSEIDYLILNHTEPDHSGSVEMLLQKVPNLVVMGSPTALTFLKEISNSHFNSKELADGEELDLGGKLCNLSVLRSCTGRTPCSLILRKTNSCLPVMHLAVTMQMSAYSTI